MATAASDTQPYRRRQRRRALIGWIGGLGVLAAVILALVLTGGGAHGPRAFKVPYGETMTARQYAEIDEGEEAADVLEGFLDASGRPERFTKEYVLVLFPPREEGDYCTYWEFSDQPQIFARLCFSESSGELVQKLKSSVLRPLTGGGQVQGQAI
jgi:hypothetical protein